MTSRIHFDDDVYLLQAMIQVLDEAMQLNIDPQFFLDKCIEDIFFIDSTLLRLYRTLKENTFLVKRTEYLRSITHCKKVFVTLLRGITMGKAAFSGALRPYYTKLNEAAEHQEHDIQEIESTILDSDNKNIEPSSAISQEEYAFLLDPGLQDTDQ
ncbi:hypothetical protein [Spirochaeta lutea]|uniref:Uncharacterized protein n=1 Tax=Spirochaeta lutea TaxID=1480694 RepID=A0A098R133_9SPIO|nr:hypothetical protein [Spirochaeta lutea]KGE73805.1 hypothetical protein DC28_00875 [Spirochaeta lutea]